MTAGQYPFEGANSKDIAGTLRNAVEGRYKPLPPDIAGGALADLIARMLVPAPLRRLTLAGVRAHPWVASAGACPGGPPPPASTSTAVAMMVDAASPRPGPACNTAPVVAAAADSDVHMDHFYDTPEASLGEEMGGVMKIGVPVATGGSASNVCAFA